MNKFSNKKILITDKQHGSIRNGSTVSKLFCDVEFIANALDNHVQVDVFYIDFSEDFSKAFDKLDFNILLKKFAYFELDSNLCSYLCSYLIN